MWRGCEHQWPLQKRFGIPEIRRIVPFCEGVLNLFAESALACRDLRVTARQIVQGYRVRWAVELFHRDVK